MPDALPTVEEFYRAMGRTIVRLYGRTLRSHQVLAPHAILGCSGLGNVFLNCGVVFGDGLHGEDPAEQRLREFVAAIRDREVGGYVCLSEGVQRRLLPVALELGLEPLPVIPLMARAAADQTLEDPSAAGAQRRSASDPDRGRIIERVDTEASLAEFLAVSEAAFDLPADLYGLVVTPDLLDDPGLSMYVLRVDGRAVSCVCVDDDDEGLCGVSGMATVPQLQGRGIGGDLLAAVLHGHVAGTRAYYLTASEAGQRLYRHHGFEVVDSATAWVVPPPAV